MTERFEGKVALVTGAGSGIGLATARAFAEAGAVAASRVQKDIDQVKAAAKEAEDNLLRQSTLEQSKLMAELNKFDRESRDRRASFST